MSDINSWLFPGAAMSANQLNWSLNNNSNQLNQMLQNQVLFNQSQPRLGEAASYYSKLSADYLRAVGPSTLAKSNELWGLGGATGASPYNTTPDVWETGAAPFAGGGGSTGLDRGWASGYGGQDTPNWPLQPGVYTGSLAGGAQDYGASLFGGLAGGLGGTYQGPSTPQIDWSNFARSAGNTFNDWSQYVNPSTRASDYGASLFSGLGGGAGATAGAGNQIDWSRLFGGAKTDPYPTMPMPGGLGQPMTLPQQQPTDYGSLFGRGAGGLGGAQQGGASQYAPAPMPSAAQAGGAQFGGLAGGIGGADQGPGSAIDWSRLWGGGSTTQETPQAAPTSTFNDRFGDWSGAPATPKELPEPVQPQSQQAPSNRYSDALYGTSTGLEPAVQGTGITAADLAGGASQRLAEAMQKLNAQPPTSEPASSEDAAAQERARLAGLIAEGSEKDVYPGEAGRAGMVSQQGENPLYPAETTAGTSPFSGYTRETQDMSPEQIAGLQYRGDLPIPKARPAAADAPQIRLGMEGRQDALNTLKSQLAERGLTMTSGYRSPNDPLSQANPHSAHSQGRAFDTRARTPEQGDAAMSQIREMLNNQGLVEGRDYKILDEVRNPSGWATGPHIHTQFTNEGMDKLQQSFGSPGRPPTDIPYPQGVPTPQERPAEAPPREVSQQPQPLPQQEQPPTPPADIPFPEGVPMPAARPNAAANLAQARSVLETPVSNLVQKFSPENASKVPSSIAAQTLREAMGNTFTGSLIRSGMGPYLGKVGVTQGDIDRAYSEGPQAGTRPIRFGGDFGTDPQFSGQLPSAGAFTPFEGFRQSPDFENRAQPSLSQQLLGYTPQEWPTPQSEDVPLSPLGRDIGVEDIRLGQEADPFSGEAGRSGYLNPQATREALANVVNPESIPQSEVNDVFKQYLKQVPAFDQQRALQEQRKPFWDQLQSNPALMDKFLRVTRSEMTQRDSPEAQQERIAFAETPANRFAAWGLNAFPTASGTDKYLSSPLGETGTRLDYYEPLRPGGTAGTSAAEIRNDPALRDQLVAAVRQALLGGSNFSNFGLENAERNSGIGRDNLRTQELASSMPITGEIFTRKTLPQFDTEHGGEHGAADTRTFQNWLRTLQNLGGGYQ